MDRNPNRPSAVWGALLIVLGVLFLFGRTLGLLQGVWQLPVILLSLGLALFIGLALGGRAGLAIPAAILIVIGLIFLAQNVYNWWEIWTYGWALIISAVGLGMVIQGTLNQDASLRQRGWRTVRSGLVLFLVFGAIFEFAFVAAGISARGNLLFWSLLLVLAGVLQLLARVIDLLRRAAPEGERGLFWPVVLIGVGLLAVTFSLGWLPPWRLVLLVNLWPLLLVAAGLHLILGRSPWVGGLLGLLVVGCMLAVGLAGEQLGLRPTFNWVGQLDSSESWQLNELIYGSGEMAEEERPVSGFDRVTLAGMGRLIIAQGASEKLMIVAEENLLPYISTRVNGGELVIGMKRGTLIIPSHTLEYRLTVKDLRKVQLAGWGDVVIQPLEVGALEVNSSGAGKIDLLDVQAEELRVRITGSGSVKAAGKVTYLDLIIQGAGSLQGQELNSQEAQITIAGFGNAVVWVRSALETRISGFGSISYYGSPTVQQHNNGIGALRRLGDR